MTLRKDSHVWRVGRVAVLAACVIVADMRASRACPFCSAAMQTLSQEIASADAAVIAELVKPMPKLPPDAAGGVAPVDPNATAVFRIVQTLRGEEKLAGAKEINVVYFGEENPQKKFLITGLAVIDPNKPEWTTPVPLSERAVEYVQKIMTLPESGSARLEFFQEYLEDKDPLLAQDSYDEFARSPYADVIALGPKMHRDRLLKWLEDPAVGPTGRRLYLTMLGICGKPEDVAMLERLLHYDYLAMKPAIASALQVASVTGSPLGVGLLDEIIHADERRKKESLDALIACYLKLKGPDGLAIVNEKFLGNPTVEYKHLHSAIMALRFHGEETDVIPREKLLDSMRLALSHKEFADQVIPDLTRWEDWEVMPRLVTMFKESPKDDWIRQPVASYLLVASEAPGEPGEQAKQALAELEAMDADTIERARSLSAFSFLAKAAAAPAADTAAGGAATPPALTASGEADSPAAESAAATAAAPAGGTGADAAGAETARPAAEKSMPRKESLAAAPLPEPSPIKLIGVPLLGAAALFAVFAVLLRGTDPRSSAENP
jgi:hypothetical protein